MSDQQHPITPPEELLRKWTTFDGSRNTVEAFWLHIATEASQWGADQELEECVKWLRDDLDVLWDGGVPGTREAIASSLRAARRPKPPSQAEEALDHLSVLEKDTKAFGLGFDASIIRSALKRLRELEEQAND